MMKISYVELIFSSDKRKTILVQLREGPKSMEEIVDILNVSSTSVYPQIKMLKEGHLLYREKRKYKLTLIGEAVVEKMQPFLDALETIEGKYDFWCSHRLDGIPPHLLNRIGELNSSVFAKSLNESSMFSPHEEFVENISKSKFVKGISPFIHPLYPKMFLYLAERNIDVSLVVTGSVFNRLRTEFRSEIEKFLALDNSHLYIHDKEIFLSCAVTDRFFSFGLFYNNSVYDHVNDIISFDSRALHWGGDLFTYYEKVSREVRLNEFRDDSIII
jgi:predicted transcriptional regulator